MESNGINLAVNKLRVDRRSSVPMYEQISDQFRTAIRGRQLSLGSVLPTNRAIQARLNVTYKTVQQAMEQLAREGFIERRQGKGTFVKGVPRLGLIGIYCHTTLLGAHDRHSVYRQLFGHTTHAIEAQQRRHRLYLGGQSPDSPNTAVNDLADDLDRRHIDGLLLLNYEPWLQRLLDLAAAREVPVVSMASTGAAPYMVRIDLRRFVHDAINHLAQMGRQRIAVIFNRRRGQLSTGDDLLSYLHTSGCRVEPAWLRGEEPSVEGGYAAASSLPLGQIDGLVVTDDTMAEGVDRYVAEQGVAVPEQLAMAIHWNQADDRPLSLRFLRFQLDMNRMVQRVMSLLTDAIAGRRIDQPHVYISPQCIDANPDQTEKSP